MPINVLERPKSRGYMNDPASRSAQLEYWAQGSDVLADVDAAIYSTAPATYMGLPKKSIDTKEEGPLFWYSVVNYGNSDVTSDVETGSETGEPGTTSPPLNETDHIGDEFAFSTGGGTEHITQSLETRLTVGHNGAVVPENEKGIGVSKDSVEGCDVIRPKFELTVTKRISFITLGDVKRWVEATGKTNISTWNTFTQRNALFLGCEGKCTAGEEWTVTFKFALSKTQFNIKIRDKLEVALKRGFDYLWVGFVDEVDNNTILKRPKYAYVERVYEECDFRTELGF